MGISLLHAPQASASAGAADKRLLYHFSLDRAFAYICPDVNKREQFFSVVTQLTADGAEIGFRQDVLRDFMRYPDLLEQLTSLYARFEELSRAQKTAGRDELRLRANGTSSVESSRNLLQAQALCLKRALLFVKSFWELLARYKLRSEGLRVFAESCRTICDNAAFDEMQALCGRYANFSAGGFLDFRFALSEEGRLAAYELIDHRYIHVTDPDLKRKGFSLFRRATEAYPCERVEPRKGDSYESLAASALSETAGVFSAVSEQIFAQYAGLDRELNFYNVSLRYVQKMCEKGAPCVFPRLSEDGVTRARGLCDLYLLLSADDPRTVVPNDFTLTDGLLVFGGNGSGKTVYLRSVGSMQILAQAGLPVPAEQAEIAPCTQIASQFSEAEKEFCEGNDAGRFEQEVRELSAMVETLREGALVFLNETFQSTAYSEGAGGLYHLLEHFSACGIRWVLVSHLRELEEMFEGSAVTVRHTADGYRVV